MFNKKVVLSKTFTSEAEYNHFKSLYDSNTTAFENRWNFEVFSGESTVAAETIPMTTPEVVAANTDEAGIASDEGKTAAVG